MSEQAVLQQIVTTVKDLARRVRHLEVVEAPMEVVEAPSGSTGGLVTYEIRIIYADAIDASKNPVCAGETYADWFLCDGGTYRGKVTPNMTSRMPWGVDAVANQGSTGGSTTKNLSHSHAKGTLAAYSVSDHAHTAGTTITLSSDHTHTASTTVKSVSDHTHSVPSSTTGSESSHTHSYSGTTAGNNAWTVTVDTGAVYNTARHGHTHTYSGTTGGGSSHSHSVSSSTTGTGGGHSHTASSSTGSAGAHTHAASTTVQGAGGHSHSISGSTSSAGSSSQDIMPPYIGLLWFMYIPAA